MTRPQILLLLVQTLFAAALLWSCFCRVVKTNAETIREIRWCIVLEACAAGMVLGAPVLPLLIPEFAGRGVFRWQPWTTPAWVWVLLLIAATLMQLVTAKFWRNSPPPDFQRSGAEGARHA